MTIGKIGGVFVAGLLFCGPAAHAAPGDWTSWGRDDSQTRFSPLTQITPANVGQLKPVWVYDSGAMGRGWEVTPIVVNNVMYLNSPSGAVALAPETGKEIWKFTADTPRQRLGKGVSWWPGDAGHGPRILYAIGDRLYALDAKTGKPFADFGDQHGYADLRVDVADKYPKALYAISAPPAIYKNLAIVSPSNQEFGSQGPSGDPRAFDVITGKLVWRFHTVPQAGEANAGSWGPSGAVERGGPSAWGIASIDAQRGLIFIPIGNPTDSYNGIDRPGPDLYANSVVALEAATGKLKWYYQITHHDLSDFDLVAPPALIDVHKDGKTIPAAVVISKNSLMFILNRETGEPIFGVTERPVPQSDVPGETYSPTQPFPNKPEMLARMSMTRDDISDVTPEAHQYCTDLWDKNQMHNDGVYAPISLKGTTLQIPGSEGGANWSGVSFDPATGFIFANVSNFPSFHRMLPDGKGSYTVEGPYVKFVDQKGFPCVKPPWGQLIAINANSGDIAWRVPLGMAEAYGTAGLATGTPNIGGSMPTATELVFIGATPDNRLRAFDARTGKVVTTIALPGSSGNSPMSFLGKDGRQYIVVGSAGPGHAGTSPLLFHALLVALAIPKPGEAIVDLSAYAPVIPPPVVAPPAAGAPGVH